MANSARFPRHKPGNDEYQSPRNVSSGSRSYYNYSMPVNGGFGDFPEQGQYTLTGINSPQPLRHNGNGGGSSNAYMQCYQYAQRGQELDPIVRPESSISNATFATQLPQAYNPYASNIPTQMLNTRPGYLGQQHLNAPASSYTSSYGGFDNGINNGLGAGLLGWGLGNSGGLQRSLPTVSEGSVFSAAMPTNANSFGHANNGGMVAQNSSNSSSRNDSLMEVSNVNSYALAQSIMGGSTEDPYDKSLSRYDTFTRVTEPTLGPARFKDTRMFSTADEVVGPDVNIANPNAALTQRPLHPPRVPDWFGLAADGLYVPSVKEAFDSLPFAELGRGVYPSNAGVLRIRDIPYCTTRQEMTAFVGRNARVLRQPEGSPFHAVHIIMERETGKTQDCFVEFSTVQEANWVVRQFGRRVESRRPPKVGDRVVTVTFSTQDELLAELFPRAKHVRWSNGQPSIDTTKRSYYEEQSAAGFQGFMHTEEIVMVSKHAALHDRSPFASKSPSRVYESMITTLYKYPWYALEFVNIRERRALYDCTTNLIRILVETLRRGTAGRYNRLDPSQSLLHELVVAALWCPGFSEKQKATITAQMYQYGYEGLVDGRRVNVTLGGNHEFAGTWPFAALSIVPGTDWKLVQYYAQLFRQATAKEPTSYAELKIAQSGDFKPMGDIKIDYGTNAEELSLAAIAGVEYHKIEALFGLVCGRPSTDDLLDSNSAPNSIDCGPHSLDGSNPYGGAQSAD